MHSVAVLPFVNATGNPDGEFLSDGLTEDIINRLAQSPELRVLARTSVFRHKNKDEDPQKIGKELQVQGLHAQNLRCCRSAERNRQRSFRQASTASDPSGKRTNDHGHNCKVGGLPVVSEGAFLLESTHQGNLRRSIDCFQQAISLAA